MVERVFQQPDRDSTRDSGPQISTTTALLIWSPGGGPMARTGVVIIDRDPSFRANVREVLHRWPGFEVVAELETSNRARDLIRDTAAEVLLLDLTLPTPADLNLVQSEHCGQTLKWVVASFESITEANLLLAIGAGAHACVAKTSAPAFIRGILTRVIGGEYPIQHDILRNPNIVPQVLKQLSRLYSNGNQPSPENLPRPITSREVRVLELAAVGMANKQIATHLLITERTVKNHLYTILRKLGAKDRTHAVYTALKSQWIQPDDPHSPMSALQGS